MATIRPKIFLDGLREKATARSGPAVRVLQML
jgi:hypothetical protein